MEIQEASMARRGENIYKRKDGRYDHRTADKKEFNCING